MKTRLAQELARVQGLFDDLYRDDPWFGNGPSILRDLRRGQRAFDSGDEAFMQDVLTQLEGITLS